MKSEDKFQLNNYNYHNYNMKNNLVRYEISCTLHTTETLESPYKDLRFKMMKIFMSEYYKDIPFEELDSVIKNQHAEKFI